MILIKTRDGDCHTVDAYVFELVGHEPMMMLWKNEKLKPPIRFMAPVDQIVYIVPVTDRRKDRGF